VKPDEHSKARFWCDNCAATKEFETGRKRKEPKGRYGGSGGLGGLGGSAPTGSKPTGISKSGNGSSGGGRHPGTAKA
jgi:hypothetical protein